MAAGPCALGVAAVVQDEVGVTLIALVVAHLREGVLAVEMFVDCARAPRLDDFEAEPLPHRQEIIPLKFHSSDGNQSGKHTTSRDHYAPPVRDKKIDMMRM